ncbi:MAG: neopullulanase, partial [Acidobacteriota bacterium]|nr:neopullulanase [Acidobacteriota bacterium]
MQRLSIHASRTKRVALLGAAFFCACCLALVNARAQQPAVLKVEPPNWWANHSINPVRVLIRGRNLAGARVEIKGTGLRASRVSTNAAGTYLFADV